MTSVYPGRAKNQFNLVAQARRQAGSTFKTFVLTTAVNQGINPATATYVSAPFHYQPDPAIPAWDVSTYSHTYAGPITVQQATLQSDNTVYAQLTLDVGPENVAAMAHKLGVESPLQPVPSIGLGSNAVSPLDMASAYATLAAGGIYSEPMAIRKVILANGKEDDQAGWGKPQRRRVIPDGVAYTVTKILEQNVLYGTGTRANFGRPAAGKTGTTDDHADAWFCGYLPNLEATVWVGYPQAEIPMENVHGIAVAGGSFPAEIWRLFMERAVRYSPAQDFSAAEDVSDLEAVPARRLRDPVRLDRHDELDDDREDHDEARDHGRGDDDGTAGARAGRADDRAGDDRAAAAGDDRCTAAASTAGDDGAAGDDRAGGDDHGRPAAALVSAHAPFTARVARDRARDSAAARRARGAERRALPRREVPRPPRLPRLRRRPARRASPLPRRLRRVPAGRDPAVRRALARPRRLVRRPLQGADDALRRRGDLPRHAGARAQPAAGARLGGRRSFSRWRRSRSGPSR